MTILRAAFELCCSSERQETGRILQFSKIYSKRKQTASAHNLQFLSSCYQLILNLFSIFVVNYCLCHSFLLRIHRPQKKSMGYLYLQISEDNPGWRVWSLEVCSPTACSRQGQLGGQTRLLTVLSSPVLKGQPPRQPVLLIKCPPWDRLSLHPVQTPLFSTCAGCIFPPSTTTSKSLAAALQPPPPQPGSPSKPSLLQAEPPAVPLRSPCRQVLQPLALLVTWTPHRTVPTADFLLRSQMNK